MRILSPLAAVVVLAALAFYGAQVRAGQWLFGVLIPYAAAATFLVFFVRRIVGWARAPVPFNITTTCGQEKSLPWIPDNKLESPPSAFWVVARMALEVLCFRSLLRNTKLELRNGPRLIYGTSLWLWAAGMAFHWSFLIILIRHTRFVFEPVPAAVAAVTWADQFFQIGLPILNLTDIVLVGAVTFLFCRRIVLPQLRYISLPADYFPLLLILAVASTGCLMCYWPGYRVDVAAVKELAMGLAGLRLRVPEGIGPMFYTHLFLVSVLFAYFPFSKLMHMGGIFLSPTRNMPNDNRMRRHVNPWNPEVKVHTYAEWEEEFREKIEGAGLPLDKE
jgi:nitrate reductase gamma subunit